MKILITGASGVIGKFLAVKLKDHDIFTPKSDAVDFTNREHVDRFFNSHTQFDLILHCAVKGGHRLRNDGWDVLDSNLKMYYNILHNKSKFKKLITFGSGAEVYGQDQPYGLSKSVIAKSILDQSNFYNIRIYGLFGEGEIETRFIRSALNNYINKKSIDVYQNIFMDFFYVEDLWTLVKYYIDNEKLPKEVDCSYEKEKKSLCGIATQINNLGDYEVGINCNSTVSFPNRYVGNETTIRSLPIELVGFNKSLKLEYEKYKLCN